MTHRQKLKVSCAIIVSAVGAVAPVAASAGGPAGAATSGSVIYRYDSLGRLVQDSYPGNAATYSYDAAGNRSQAAVQGNAPPPVGGPLKATSG